MVPATRGPGMSALNTRPHRGCEVRPGELTANCAAVAAVAATAKTYATGSPRPRTNLINVKTTRSGFPRHLDPKTICKQAKRQHAQACPPSAGGKTGADADTKNESEAEGDENAGTAGTDGAAVRTGAGPGGNTVSNDSRDNAHQMCKSFAGGGYYQGSGASGYGPDWQLCIPQSQGQMTESHGQPLPQKQANESQEQPLQGQVAESQGQASESQGQAAESQGQAARLQGQVAESQRQAAESQRQAAESQEQAAESQGKGAKSQGQAPAQGSGAFQESALKPLQEKTPHTVGSCICDGKATPSNASFRSKTPRFPEENVDGRPWYCTAPNLHELSVPRSPLSPAPPNAPFYRSGARFSVDTHFKAPAPNTYLPPVMGKVRWSGVLTGYHGIPSCYNIVDRNCDLSTVHMHCVMCPPRGIYDKSIGKPLREIFPDDKLHEDQLRHMCTWHSGEVKRAYHQRGMYNRGCTEGIAGRSNVGPSGFRTDNIGCSCSRCDHHGGILDDATLEKMSAELNRKRRDPDTFMTPSVCLKFGAGGTAEAADAAASKEKKALKRAQECKRRCADFQKSKQRADAKYGEKPEADTKYGKKPEADAKYGEKPEADAKYGKKPEADAKYGEKPEADAKYGGKSEADAKDEENSSRTPEPRSSRARDSQERRLPRVTEGGEDFQTEVLEGDSELPAAEYEAQAQENLTYTACELSAKESTVTASVKFPHEVSHEVRQEKLGPEETVTGYPENTVIENSQRKSTPGTVSERSSAKVSIASSKTSQRPESAGAGSAGSGRQSTGVLAQNSAQSHGSRSTNPCAAITLQCRCSSFNKVAPTPMSFPKQCAPQEMSQSPYGEQNIAQYGQQSLRHQDQLGQRNGPQEEDEQYRNECEEAGYRTQIHQEEQLEVQGRQEQTGWIPTQQGQRYGFQVQEGQQYEVQGQHGLQYGSEGLRTQPYGNMNECLLQHGQHGSPDQQYDAQYATQGVLYSGQYGIQNQQTQQYGLQDQQSQQYEALSQQDQQFPSAVGLTGCPHCPPCPEPQQRRSGTSSGMAQFYRLCASGASISLGSSTSCTPSNTRKRIINRESTNTNADEDNEGTKSTGQDEL